MKLFDLKRDTSKLRRTSMPQLKSLRDLYRPSSKDGASSTAEDDGDGSKKAADGEKANNAEGKKGNARKC